MLGHLPGYYQLIDPGLPSQFPQLFYSDVPVIARGVRNDVPVMARGVTNDNPVMASAAQPPKCL